MRKVDVTADLLAKAPGGYYGLVQTAEGAFDVYGETLADWKKAAIDIAVSVGATIDVWNLETPE